MDFNRYINWLLLAVIALMLGFVMVADRYYTYISENQLELDAMNLEQVVL